MNWTRCPHFWLESFLRALITDPMKCGNTPPPQTQAKQKPPLLSTPPSRRHECPPPTNFVRGRECALLCQRKRTHPQLCPGPRARPPQPDESASPHPPPTNASVPPTNASATPQLRPGPRARQPPADASVPPPADASAIPPTSFGAARAPRDH